MKAKTILYSILFLAQFAFIPSLLANEVSIKIEWVNDLEGDFSFKEKWDYPENVFRSQHGQLVCDWICPEELDQMRDDEGKIIPDSLEAYYQLLDTTHLYHSLQSTAQVYEWAGSNYIHFKKLNDGSVRGTSTCNASTHSSLILELDKQFLKASIHFNSIRDLGIHEFQATSGSIKIDQKLFEQGIVKAAFDLTFKNTLDQQYGLYWKGQIYSIIQ
ncbi:MAG: hypothetical protein MI810_21045 [Flavobacteriales bacterium]|nr:hypothetical protein [Flavobacteriales bacterium]